MNSAVKNARAFLKIQEEFGSFDAYIWGFVDGRPVQNEWKSIAELPAKTELSETISKDLKNRGFSFVGPTIVYAFLQAVGMVNDQTVDGFRHKEISKLGYSAGSSSLPVMTVLVAVAPAPTVCKVIV